MELFIGKFAANITIGINGNINSFVSFPPKSQTSMECHFNVDILDFSVYLYVFVTNFCQILVVQLYLLAIERVFLSFYQSTNGQPTKIQTAEEVCKNTFLLSIKL